jgi:hypothetical protein
MKITQSLPFSVVMSRDKGTSARLLATRQRAFDRHDHPVKTSEHFKKQLKLDSGVLISAESKLSGECLGSIRIDSNVIERFYFEHEVNTPDLEERSPSICASRLSVTKGPEGGLARMALCKALYLYSHAMQAKYVYCFVDHSRFRLYRNLGFEAVFAGNPNLVLECHNGIPTKLVRSEVNTLENKLLGLSPILKSFFFDTHHPDIKIFASVASIHQVRRRGDGEQTDLTAESRLLPSPTV